MAVEYEFPFYSLSDYELKSLCNTAESFCDTLSADYLVSLKGSVQSDFLILNTILFSNQFHSYSTSIDLSVLHMNNRSLNSRVCSFCHFIHLLDYMFDVIVFSEIWAYNIDYYRNILPGYEFYYNLPIDSKVGGVGIFVRNCYSVQELNHF